MFSLTLTDLVRAYSTKRNAFKLLIIEMIFVFLLIIISLFFTSMSSPNYANIQNLNVIFTLGLEVFKSNFIGIFVTMFLDVIFFSLLFNKVFCKIPLYTRFITSSILSAIVIITIYTYVVNGEIFYKLYPHYWLKITNYSIITNIIMIIFYSFVCSGIFRFINLYLEKK